MTLASEDREGGEGLVDLGEDVVDGDGGEAAFLFEEAGLEAAAGAGGGVVEDAVVGSVGEPDAGQVACGEDGDAGGLDGGGEVHGAAVVAEEEAGAGEDGGTLAGGEVAAEVENGAGAWAGTGGGTTPALGGEGGGGGLLGGAAEGEGVVGVAFCEAGEESAPVGHAPVLRLYLGADADGEDGTGAGGGEELVGAGVLGWGEAEIPAAGVVEAGVAEDGEGAGETGGLGLEVMDWGLGGERVEVRGGRLGAVALEVGSEGDAEVAGDAAEVEEEGVAAGSVEAAGGGEVDEDLGAPAADGDGEGEEIAGIAGGERVAEVAVDEVSVAEDGLGGGRLGVDGEVGEEAAFGAREGAGDEMEGGQGDDRVSEATQAVDEDALRGGFQGGNSLEQEGTGGQWQSCGVFPFFDLLPAVRSGDFRCPSGADGEGCRW
jgi:hypothetical protein